MPNFLTYTLHRIVSLNTLLESFLNKIPFQNHKADSDPNSNTTFNSVVNISNYIHLIQNNINQTNYIYSPNILSNTNNNADGSVETKQTSTTNNKFWDDLSINNDALKNDHQPNENITEKNKSIYDELFDEYKTKYKNAIVGDELIKMFVFLEQNVKLKTRRNSDPNVIKYSAIYFILKEKIQEEIKRKIKSSENTDWYINKKELGNILDLTLKNSKKEITKQHLSVVRNFLNDYK